MRPSFDDRDSAILAARLAALSLHATPRCGDYVIFACGTTRRISHIWGPWDGDAGSVQTSDDGSFYLGGGYVSFSGGLHPGVSPATLTLTEETRAGHVWFFHHDHWGADRGVHVDIPFRVYTCTEEAP